VDVGKDERFGTTCLEVPEGESLVSCNGKDEIAGERMVINTQESLVSSLDPQLGLKGAEKEERCVEKQ